MSNNMPNTFSSVLRWSRQLAKLAGHHPGKWRKLKQQGPHSDVRYMQCLECKSYIQAGRRCKGTLFTESPRRCAGS